MSGVFDTEMCSRALLGRVEQIAGDVGRLRRRFDANSNAWTGSYICTRLAEDVQTLDLLLHATAGELVTTGVDVERALAIVDARSAQLDRLLGEPKR